MNNPSIKDKQFHMTFNIFRILSYLIVYGIFGVLLFIYLRSYMSLMILVVFLAVPLTESFLLVKFGPGVRVDLCVSDETFTIGDKVGIGINIVNNSFFSSLCCKCKLELNNLYLDMDNSVDITLPLHPKSTKSHPIMFDSLVIGIIDVKLTEIKIWDVFGFVGVCFHPSDEEMYVKILPTTEEPENSVKESLLLGINDNEDESKPGKEFAETGNIKEYVPGDRLKDIHWKLSAKRDILLVKERISTSDSKLVLWIGSSSGAKVCEKIISLSLSVLLDSVAEGRLIKAIWFDFHKKEVCDCDIMFQEDVYNAIEKIYLSGHGENTDSFYNLLMSSGYNYKNILAVVFDGNDVKVDVYEN